MEQHYKNFYFVASAELDAITKQWNGRYRIVDDEGIVAFESFVDPVSSEREAFKFAEVEAKQWIDMQ